MEVKLDETRLTETKSGRNSGRTFDALYGAIQKLSEYPTVIFVVSCETEARRLGRDVGIICEYLNRPVESRDGRHVFRIDSTLLLVQCAHYAGKGCRGFVVLDHSCREFLTPDQYREMLLCLNICHVGPMLT